MLATIYGQTDVVRILLSAGANVQARDINDMRAIVYASALDRGEIYGLLEVAMGNLQLPAGAPRNRECSFMAIQTEVTERRQTERHSVEWPGILTCLFPAMKKM